MHQILLAIMQIYFDNVYISPTQIIDNVIMISNISYESGHRGAAVLLPGFANKTR